MNIRQKFKKSVGSFDRDSSFETIYDYIPYSQPDIMTITSEKKVMSTAKTDNAIDMILFWRLFELVLINVHSRYKQVCRSFLT